MAGQKTVTTANKVLDHVLGGPDLVRPANAHIGIKTSAGVEVSGGGYARVALANNATNFPAAANGLKSSAVDVAFAVATADWGESGGCAIYDAPTAGWEIAGGFLGGNSSGFTAKTTDTISAPGHTLAVNDKVRVLTISGIALPSGLAIDTTYFVKTVSAEDLTLSATQGGAAIDLVSAGSGRIGKYEPKTVQAGDQFVLKAGQIDWVEA